MFEYIDYKPQEVSDYNKVGNAIFLTDYVKDEMCNMAITLEEPTIHVLDCDRLIKDEVRISNCLWYDSKCADTVTYVVGITVGLISLFM